MVITAIKNINPTNFFLTLFILVDTEEKKDIRQR